MVSFFHKPVKEMGGAKEGEAWILKMELVVFHEMALC